MTSSGKPVTTLVGSALVAALVVIAAWLALLSYLTFHTQATEVEWARLLSVLGSLEAIAFAAAGALFGSVVQKRRVEDAGDRANKAEERASQAERTSADNLQAAANGKALATAIKARAVTTTSHGVERVNMRDEKDRSNDELLALARRLFPGDSE